MKQPQTEASEVVACLLLPCSTTVAKVNCLLGLPAIGSSPAPDVTQQPPDKGGAETSCEANTQTTRGRGDTQQSHEGTYSVLHPILL